MAFTLTEKFTNNLTDGSMVFWDAEIITLTTGLRQADSSLTFFNPGGTGSFSKIYIMVQAKSVGGNSTFDYFWKGAAKFDGIFDITHDFWTGIAVTTTQTTFMYWANNEQVKLAVGGTAAVSDYMFEVPYIAFGLENTGANTITFNYVVLAQLV